MSKSRHIPPVIKAFLLIDLLFGIFYVLNYLVGRPIKFITTLLNLDAEGNVPTWYASMQWFCVAALVGLFVQTKIRRAAPKTWALALLPLIFLFFSIDEVAQIHEWIGRQSDALLPHGSRKAILFSRTGIWMFLLGIPFAVIFGWLVISLRSHFKHAPGALAKIVIGVVIMFGGAVGVEMLSNFVSPSTIFGVLEIAVEETMEMVGSSIVLWGSLELFQTTHVVSIDRSMAMEESDRKSRAATTTNAL